MARPVDNFDDNSLNTTSVWAATTVLPIYISTVLGLSAGGTRAETNQRLEISPSSGVAGVSSFDTAINDNNTDVIVKVTDLDVANMANGDGLIFGIDKTGAGRYAMFSIGMSGGVISVGCKYLGGLGYGGTEPTEPVYSSTDHVWLKVRQLSANNNDVEWSVAPAGAGANTPGAWTVIRRLSDEAGWAGHLAALGGGPATAFDSCNEGVYAGDASGGGWVPKIDNFNFTETASSQGKAARLLLAA